MLTMNALTKRFGDKVAVDRVSIAVPRGQMVGVIGRSGAGKSTLLRMINRLTEPSDGALHWNEDYIGRLGGAELRAWRSRSAMIFQQFNLVGRLDVLTNVLLGRLNHRPLWSSLMTYFSEEERARAILQLDRLDMATTALQRADTLSGGQQQRVAIARAMMQEPEILLADEPIASLDPRNAAVVMDALKRINREDGITVLCNLHTLDTARRYCNRIIGMAAGRVVFDGAPEDLTTQMAETIYGVDGLKEQLAESITSTEIGSTPVRQDEVEAVA
ncbi:MAG: phosphonate ABC transporter ATP-binding protein [Alphaproteobacteria bacterium]